jgi:hypothetical protein
MNIVEWLRLWAPSVGPKLDEAADEIEKLLNDARLAEFSDTEYCKKIQSDNERLRKENQKLALDLIAVLGQDYDKANDV